MNSNLSVSRDVRSTLSTASRRDVLWNVSEPGDPYDIRRSMIASLPGDKKKFMGDHLQLICLLQAAEIERLCEFLDDYKLKFRQVERSNLDRHSYEIQIKQLTEKVGLEESLRNQNNKLKEFSKRMQSEIQLLQRNTRTNYSNDEQNKINYERSLERITLLSNENREFILKHDESNYHIQNLQARYESLEKAKNKEIEEIKLYYSQILKEQYQSNLLTLRIQGESEIKRLEYEIKRLKQNNDSKNIEIADLQKKLQAALSEVNHLRGRTDGNYHLERQIMEYENKFILFGQEIQRLNITLRDYTIRLEESETRRRELDRRLDFVDKENNEFMQKLQSKDIEINHLNESLRNHESQNLKIRSSQQVIYDYESKLNFIKIQNQKLTSQIRYELENAERFKQQIKKLSFENSRFKLLQKENAGLKSSASEIINLKRLAAELQNKNSILLQQLERVNVLINSKDSEIERFRNLSLQNENLKTQSRQLEYSIKSKYEVQLSRVRSEYESKLQVINRSRGTQTQYKLENYERQIQKLRKTIETASLEVQDQRNKIYEYQNSARRREIEYDTKIRNYQSNLSSLRRENEELLYKLKLLEGSNLELQNKLNSLERTQEGSSLNLKSREEEILLLRSKLRQTEEYVKTDITRTKMTYEQNYTQVRTENEELKRRYNDLVNQSNKKLQQAAQELQRLSSKLHERDILQNDKRLLQQQSDILKQNMAKIKQEYDELRKRYVDLQTKIHSIQNDSSYTFKNLSLQNESLKKQLNSNEQESNKRSMMYEQNQSNLKREADDLRRKLAQYQSKLVMISQEFDRLSSQLKTRTDEYNLIREELEVTKRNFKKYESDVTSQFEGEIKRKFIEQENIIRNITAENQQLKKTRYELEANTSRVVAENERLNSIIKQQTLETEGLKKSISQYNLNITNYEVQIKNKYSLFETNILNITKASEDVQRRLLESENGSRRKSEELLAYENSNRQLVFEMQNIKKQFKEYESSITQKYSFQLNQKNQALQDMSAKLTHDNQDLRRNAQEIINDFNRKLAQSEKRYLSLTQEFQNLKRAYAALGQQNEGLRKKMEGLNSEVTNYEGEVKRRFSTYEQTINKLQTDNEQLRRKLQDAGDYLRKISEYQNRIALLSQELERLTNNLKVSKEDNDNLRRQLKQQQHSSQSYSVEINKRVADFNQGMGVLQRQNEQLKRRLVQYEQRMQEFQLQYNKLNANYKSKTQQLAKIDHFLKNTQLENSRKVGAYDQSLKNLQLANEEMKKKLFQLGDVNRKAGQIERRLIQASQQVERLMEALRAQQQRSVKLQAANRSVSGELEGWKKKYSDLQANFKNTYEFEIKKQFMAYEQTINDSNRRGSELQAKLSAQLQEIERLNNILRLKVEESSQFSFNHKGLAAQYEQFKRKARDNENIYNTNISSLKRENEDWRRKLQEFEQGYSSLNQQSDRRLAEYENKFKILGQQLERLNQMLKTKNDELENMKKQFRQYEVTTNNKFEAEIKNKTYQYENNIHSLNEDNAKSKKRIQDYENTLAFSSQEIERLTLILQNKSDEITRATRENEELRKKIYEFGDVNRKFQEYEQRLVIISQQNQKLQASLRSKIEDVNSLENKLRASVQQGQNLRRSVKQVEFNFNNRYQTQVRSRFTTYEQTIVTITRQKEEVNKKRLQYESRIALLSQQVQRLNLSLSKKSQENSRLLAEIQAFKNKANQKIQSTESEYISLQNNYGMVVKEYENAKMHLQQYESSIKKLYLEFERLQGIINQLKKERQALHEMNHNLSNEINRLTAENKDLEVQAQEVRLKLSDESSLQKRINEHLSLMVILFAQIETLRLRVKDKEKQVAEVRRSSLAPNIL